MASQAITGKTKELTDRVLSAVHEVAPGAEVILYGSRARGDADPDADWDLLVLVDGPASRELEEAVTDRLFELGLEMDAVLSPIVHSRDDWNSALYRAMPFRQNVAREGIPL